MASEPSRLSFEDLRAKLIEYWAASDPEIEQWARTHGNPQPIDPSRATAPLRECTFASTLLNEFAPTLSANDRAIPYRVARRLLIERLKTQDSEILAWATWHGRPRIYGDTRGTLRARRAVDLLARYPFDDSPLIPFDRLQPYLFSRTEITEFDPAADWVQRAGYVDNPSGRYFSLAQVARFLEQDAPADQVQAAILSAFTSGRWEAPDVSPANEATALPQLLEALKYSLTLPELEILEFRRGRFGIEFGRPDEISNRPCLADAEPPLHAPPQRASLLSLSAVKKLFLKLSPRAWDGQLARSESLRAARRDNPDGKRDVMLATEELVTWLVTNGHYTPAEVTKILAPGSSSEKPKVRGIGVEQLP